MTTTPMFETLVDALVQRAAQPDGGPVFTFLHEDGHSESHHSTAEMLSMARAIAAHLQLDSAPGDRAILVYPQGLEFIAAFFGCLLAGLVPVPVHAPRDARSARRLAQMVSDSGAKIMMTGEPLTELIQTQAPVMVGEHVRVLSTDSIPRGDESGFRSVDVSPDDLAFLQYTSGSTAFPKGVMVFHRHLAANLEMIRQVHGQTEGDTWVSWLPVFHDLGLIGATFGPLWFGMRSVQMSPIAFLKTPIRWLRTISRFRASHSGGPNFAFDLCVKKFRPSEDPDLDLSSLRYVFNAAEPVRMTTIDRFSKTFEPYGFRKEMFAPNYGMAEATLIISGASGLNRPREVLLNTDELGRGRVIIAGSDSATSFVACGKPAPGFDVKVVNPDTLSLCAEDEIGEFWTSSFSVAGGYWNKAEETAATFQARIPGHEHLGTFLRTGDLGFVHEGELFMTGRHKDLIIIRGTNHYPQDIELTSQESHPALRPGCVAAFAVEDADGEGLVVLQEVARDTGAVDYQGVCAAIREAITSTHQLVPDAIVLLPAGSLTKTSSGKIQRRPNREAYRKGEFEVLGAWQAPRAVARATPRKALEKKPEAKPTPADAKLQKELHDIERWLKTWLCERMKIATSQIRMDDSLSSFGLDSLGLAELVADLEHDLGIEISEQTAWSHPTIQLLVAYLARLRSEKSDGAGAMPMRPSASEPAAGQKRVGVFEGSLVSFYILQGSDLIDRVMPFYEWQSARREIGIWPYSKAIQGHAGPTADVAGDDGIVHQGINLASIDYLGLARHPAVIEAVNEATRDFGVHSTSTCILQGNSTLSLRLEDELTDMFHGAATLLFPTGWAAGFGSVSAFVRPEDYVLMDLLGHACLQTGARYATRNVMQYGHLDADHCRKLLAEIRSRDTRNGILVVTEGLYSMDSDWPDIARLQETCHEFGARMLIDVAHDISSFGPEGTGQIGVQDMLGKVDLVMGGFSKSLATNGGFLVLPSEAAKQYAKIFAGTHMFSSGPTPIAVGVAHAAIRISRSAEGDQRRSAVMRNVNALRAAFRGHGLSCIGDASPIVPVLVGSEAVVRVASRLIAERGVNASVIEYPAVPLGAARFRMQLTPDHTIEQMRQVAKVVSEAISEARQALEKGHMPWEPATVGTRVRSVA